MKIWIKYLLAAVLGLLLSFFLPSENQEMEAFFEKACRFVINAGRYALYPLLFFSFAIAIYKLKEMRVLIKTARLSALIIAGAAILCAITGAVSVLIFAPSRIPVLIEGNGAVQGIGIWMSIMSLFPASAFEVFQDSAFILPLCIFSSIIGLACATDKITAKPVVAFFDSFSKVIYTVTRFFVEIVSVGMIAVSVHWFLQYRKMIALGIFTNFIVILLGNVIFIALVLYPISLKLVCKIKNPYKILYASIASVIAAFFSGDANMTLAVIIRNVHENLMIRRRIAAVVPAVFSVFSRPGSALTASASFIVILNSYSSIGIAFFDIMWLIGICSLLSLLLGRFTAGGPYILLATVCAMYGRGLEENYLILRPAAFFICSAASLIDSLTAVLASFIVASKVHGTIKEVKRN